MATDDMKRGRGSMQAGPDPVDFGAVPPQWSADATFTIPHAQCDAHLTANIVADNSQGRFRIIWLKSFANEREGGARTTDIEKDSSDGSRPLTVSAGQRVEIALRFYSLVPKAQDYFKAVLVIQDGSAKAQWQPIRAGMIALVGGITTILPPIVHIVRGQRVSVPITIVSDAGPETTVSYTLRSRPSGISMATVQVSVARGTSVAATLDFASALTALLGTQDVILESAAFDGKLVTPMEVTVDVRSLDPIVSCQWLADRAQPWSENDKTFVNWGIVDSSETPLGILRTRKLFRPEDQYELSSAIRQAEAAGATIRALGSGWSFSDAVLPQPEPIASVETAAVGNAVFRVNSKLHWRSTTRRSPSHATLDSR